MNKIEEMAMEAGYDGYHRAPFEKGFIRGANAVLKEIEPLVATLRSGARKLFEEKFKELKGE